jgi:hypothetical protein
VVGRLRQSFENLRIAVCVERGTGNDFLEKIGADVSRAGERREDAAGFE